MECRHCKCHERDCGVAADFDPGEDCSSGEDASLYGHRRASFSWQESSGKELDGTRRNSTGRRTRRSTEAKQKWITRESNASRPRVRSWRKIRVRKETLRAAYKEIKILREDLLREGDSVDRNRSHIMSPESTEEIRNLEQQQELNLWSGAASKRLVGWTRDGWSTEEIASWSVEVERISREVEAKKRKLQEAIEKESTMKDVSMSDDGLDGLDGSLSS